MASAGFLIGNLTAQPVVCTMGNCIGRGTVISMALVLFVLPSVLVLGDSIINRTSFKIKVAEPVVRKAEGLVRVRGHIRGYVCGTVDASVDGVVHGKVDAMVSTGGEVLEGGDADE